MKKPKIITICAAMALMSSFALIGCGGRNVEVLFDGNGGTPDKTSVVAVDGASLPAVPAPTRDGYTFTGWYSSSDCNENSKWQAHYKVESGITLYAGWTKDSYITVKFDTLAGGDSVQNAPQDVKIKSGSLVTEPKTPTRDGYIFKNWYKDEVLSESFDFSGDTVSEDAVLYAKWAKLYTVSVKLNDEVTSSYKIEEGKTLERIPVPNVKDKMFIGFYEDAAFSDKAEYSQKVTADLTLYVKAVVPTDTSLYNIRLEKESEDSETDYYYAYFSTKTHLDELVLPSEIDGKQIIKYRFSAYGENGEELYLDADTLILPSGANGVDNFTYERSKVKNFEIEYEKDSYLASYDGCLYYKDERWENNIKHSTYVLSLIPNGKETGSIINIMPNSKFSGSLPVDYKYRLLTAPTDDMLKNGIPAYEETTFIVPDEYIYRYKNADKLKSNEKLIFISESEYAASIAESNGGSL